jgi:NADP-dependent 3-hydroxy acid dehydrogenase YdfG
MSKTILITGTSSGFGKLSAITLAKAGYTVIATMRQIEGKNKEAANELATVSGIEVLEMDVTNESSVIGAVNKTLFRYGVIDVLINNAGVAGFGLLEAYSLENVQRLFDINVYGVLRTYKAVLPSMRARRSGLIINISSGLGLFAAPNTVAYAATKFAVEAINEGYHAELKSFGIENVSIQCGAYPTEIATKVGVNADQKEVIDSYGELPGPGANERMERIMRKIREFNMIPQIVADGILQIVEMENGSRPQQFPLDAVAQGADHEYIQTRNTIKAKWFANHQ